MESQRTMPAVLFVAPGCSGADTPINNFFLINAAQNSLEGEAGGLCEDRNHCAKPASPPSDLSGNLTNHRLLDTIAEILPKQLPRLRGFLFFGKIKINVCLQSQAHSILQRMVVRHMSIMARDTFVMQTEQVIIIL